MATFKAEVQNERADMYYNIRIRVTHNRVVRRISTHLYAVGENLKKIEDKKYKVTQSM